jgi:hypothetical protein
MKRIFTLCIALCTIITGFAQTDSTGTNKAPESDTIRIGGMIIIRKTGNKDKEITREKEYRMHNRRTDKPANLSTNWWIVDLGFSNYNDESNYAAAISSGFVSPGIGKDELKLKAGKSRNVNIWFFMQKLNVVKHVVNLKYGLGLELNNYHFDNIVFSKNPTFISESATDIHKTKLAADYLTVPLMVNFNFTPKKKNGFGLSAGISGGYLYSARYKTKNDGKVNKIKDDFNLERFKLAYIAELSLGPVRLYGSYATKNMWEKGLDMTPYNFGFRLSNW